MDIRSFFAKKKDTAKKKKSTPPTTTASSTRTITQQTPSSRRSPSTTTPTSKKRRQPTSSPHFSKSKRTKKEKEEEEDSDATTDDGMNISPVIQKKNASNKKNQIVIDDDDDSDATADGEVVVSPPPPTKKSKGKAPTKQTEKSAKKKKDDDFYDSDDATTTDDDQDFTPKKTRQTAAKSKLPSKKKSSITKNDDVDSDATTTDDENAAPPPTFSKAKKGPIQKGDEQKIEISAADFFSSTNTTTSKKSAKKKPVAKKAPVKSEEDDFLSSDDKNDDDDDDDDYVQKMTMKKENDDDDFEMKASPRKSTRAKKRTTTKTTTTTSSPPSKRKPPPSPDKKTKPATPPTKKRKTTTTKQPKPKPPKPPTPLPSYPTSSAKNPSCLQNYTFVITGVLSSLSREDAIDYIKILGGRVTTAVSSRTDYLIIGSELEDGRNVQEGSKYRKAKELNEKEEDSVVILKGEEELFGLTQFLDETTTSSVENHQDVKREEEIKKEERTVKKKTVTNPYARKTVTNPYDIKAPVTNPYANTTSTTSNPYAKSRAAQPSPSKKVMGGGRASVNDANALWADKYAPGCTREILGNQEAVRKLSLWLAKWEDTFNNPRSTKRSFGSPNGPWKAALLSGPPGIGKTTTALLVAQESKRDVLELNASDTRSKKGLSENLGDVTGSKVLNFTPSSATKKKRGNNNDNSKKRCIIMDEVDGMGAGDRSGISELIKMIKSSKVPIICICNDRQSQKIKSLVPYCLDLRYRRPVKSIIAKRAVEIGQMEGMRVEINAAETIAESCGNDIRQVVNCLQMWSNKKRLSSGGGGGGGADMTYKAVKENQNFINKDEILRVSMFDATRLIVEGCRGLQKAADSKVQKDSLYKRTDAFFVDYSLMGLNVHQNYLKVIGPQFQETKRKADMDAELNCLERMYEATQSMSDFAIAENTVRGGDQLWELLPLCSVLAVKTGHHVGGENGGFLSGYPEFAGWLGKNSSKNRKVRLLQELSYHMNYKVSAGPRELRLGYVPALRKHLLSLMMDKEGAKTSEVIELMDEYGLDRDDLFENIDEFNLEPKGIKFADLDSKAKAAFTREYNKGVHKSQALVAEQGVGKTRKKVASDTVKESEDLDAVNDDKVSEEDEEEESEEMDAEAIQALFQKKGKKSAAPGKKKAASAKGRKRK